AVQAGRDYAILTKDPTHLLLALVRFGRFDDVLEMSARPAAEIPAATIWDFAHGYAHLRGGNRTAAKADFARLQRAVSLSTTVFNGHPAKQILGILAGILEGEISRADGNLPAAI